jgi:hypothetical protein
VEQFIFPYQKVSQDFWELKNYLSQNVSDNAIVQTPLEFSPATIYSLERKIVYHPLGLIFYPDNQKAEKIKNDLASLFVASPKESKKMATKYKIDYLLIENQKNSFTESPFFKKVFGNTSYSLYQFEEISPSKQTL